MKRGKKILITLGVLLVLVGAAFVIFHDNSDVEEIEKRQLESIEEVSGVDDFEALSNIVKDDLESMNDSTNHEEVDSINSISE